MNGQYTSDVQTCVRCGITSSTDPQKGTLRRTMLHGREVFACRETGGCMAFAESEKLPLPAPPPQAKSAEQLDTEALEKWTTDQAARAEKERMRLAELRARRGPVGTLPSGREISVRWKP